jgi:voltage-gated potassium channel
MAWEGRSYSWVTGFYWTLTVMSTLGFGDITFHSDLGRLFSMVVLLIRHGLSVGVDAVHVHPIFYAPWMEAQRGARAPQKLPPETTGGT